MRSRFYTVAGISLLLGSLIMIATLVLHPVGGSLQRLISLYNLILVSHCMAIAAIPLVAFGFYGLSKLLLDYYRVSYLAMIIMYMALIAVMMAGSINGLVLPFFLRKMSTELTTDASIINIVVQYGFSINKAMDYIFIAGASSSVAIWSVLIIKTRIIHKWLGYFGILLNVAFLTAIFTGLSFTHLAGFSAYVSCLAAWIIVSALSLLRVKQDLSGIQKLEKSQNPVQV